MAGVVPKKSASGRKQWTLLDGSSKSSLKRLRSQLASDGCPESQVVLAKQLLEEDCEFESQKKENARIGVFWLIKASEQGNLEATNILKSCLETGKGINEHNYMDVKSCITMTQDEKLARKAAREMFASLSNGGEYITSEQLKKKILAIDRGETCSKSTETSYFENNHLGGGELMNDEEDYSESEDDTDWSTRSDISNEKLTEDHLLAAAVDYSHGQLPDVNRILCLSDPDLRALDHIPIMHRSILHPILALKILYFKLILFLGQKSWPVIRSLIRSQVHVVLLLLTYVFFNSDNVIYIFPMLLYYVSFVIMICSTFQMLQNQREFVDFRLWSGLFICYSGGGLNANETEHQYIKNNIKPYGQFFVSLLVNLFMYSFISEQWIPQSELAILSFLFTFMTLIGFMPKIRSKTVFDMVVLFSFGLNVLAKYPYETDPVVTQGWRFLELNVPTFPSYIIGNGIEFCINFRFILFSCIPLILIKIAHRQNWRGTYKTLIPHCVTLSWLQICIISSQGATMYGFLRGTLALVGVVSFLPLVGITSVILPVVALTKWIITSNFIYTVCIFIILSTLGFGICYVCAQTRYKKYTAIIQIVLMILAFFVLINSSREQTYYGKAIKPPEAMSWEVYQRFCHQPIWQEENTATSQIKCVGLEGVTIQWNGYISEIKLKSVLNIYKSAFDKLPRWLSQHLYCMFGDENKSDCENIPDIVKDNCLSFYDMINSINYCSLQKYDQYTFEIVLKMHSGIWGKATEVTLIANDYFKNFILKLKPTDHIWFKGQLFNNHNVGADGLLGGLKPHVHLEELGCSSCQDNNLSEIKLVSNSGINIYNIYDSACIGVKFILNVFFKPFLIFK